MEFLLVVAQAGQPSGEAAQNAEQAGQGFGQIAESVGGFISMAANSQYGWVVGAVVLYLIFRYIFRLAR